MRTCQYPISKTPKDVVGGVISLNSLLESWYSMASRSLSRSLTSSSSSNMGCRFYPWIRVGIDAMVGGGAAPPLCCVAAGVCSPSISGTSAETGSSTTWETTTLVTSSSCGLISPIANCLIASQGGSSFPLVCYRLEAHIKFSSTSCVSRGGWWHDKRCWRHHTKINPKSYTHLALSLPYQWVSGSSSLLHHFVEGCMDLKTHAWCPLY